MIDPFFKKTGLYLNSNVTKALSPALSIFLFSSSYSIFLSFSLFDTLTILAVCLIEEVYIVGSYPTLTVVEWVFRIFISEVNLFTHTALDSDETITQPFLIFSLSKDCRGY